MCPFPLEIQQCWNISKFKESVNVAKFEYVLGNMKDCENQSTATKKGDSQNAYNYWRFLKKNRWCCSRTKKGHSKNAYNYRRFWRILMIRRAGEGLRTFSFWVWQPPQQDFEAPMISRQITHYVILSLPAATARFWKVLVGEFERHCRRVTKMRLLAGGKSRPTLMD